MSDPLSGNLSATVSVRFSAGSSGTVTAVGSTSPGTSDVFFGQAGLAYTLTIAPGSDLSTIYDNSANTEVNGFVGVAATTTLNTPNGELIAFDTGTVINHGTLNTYPFTPPAGTSNLYHKTANVVFLADGGTLINDGRIGDEDLISNRSNPHYAYAQEDFCALYITGTSGSNNYILNKAGGILAGYNAIFSEGSGSGTVDNYGMIYASNDCVLTGYTVNNYVNAGLNSGVAGFASAHAYGSLNNWGFVIGNDYGIWESGNNLAINDYAGTAVAGVLNFDGSQVYNGEISSLIRGSETINTSGTYDGGDAVLLSGGSDTLNLISSSIGGTLYLPVVLGPIVGNNAAATPAKNSVLNFDFTGLTAIEMADFDTAIAGSAHAVTGGTIYSGTFTLRGHRYDWEDFSAVHLVACFAAGTRIRTTAGDVAVEHLMPGERISLARGGTAPVVWIGQRCIDCTRHPHPERVRPIQVRADAFGPGLPRRDLLLSPDHAVLWGDVLIPIKQLVNGVSIARLPADHVHYYHVELPAHDVLIAEGLPAESYLDTGNRAFFANGGIALDLHPDFPSGERGGGCLACVSDGPAVTAARAAILDRLVAEGWTRSSDPDLHLLVDGQVVRSSDQQGRVARFRLAAPPRAVRLRSNCAAPTEVTAEASDVRTLGVAIRRIVVTDGRRSVSITADDVRLTDGFHSAEPGWRWTDGDALLPPIWHGDTDGPSHLDVDIAGWQQVWTRPLGPGIRSRHRRD